jgi:hypothetical protein
MRRVAPGTRLQQRIQDGGTQRARAARHDDVPISKIHRWPHAFDAGIRFLNHDSELSRP